MYGENAPPSWARLPGARCRAVEHLTKLDGLKEFELFEGLEERFFQDLAIAAEVLELAADTALYREGEPSGAVYFMREGRVKIYRTSGGPKVRDQILGVVGEGSVLGLGAALEGRTQTQGATALTDCVLYAVFRDDLFEMMGRFPEGAVRLARVLAASNRELEDLVGDLVFRSAPQRVASMLLNLATEEGRVTKRGVVFEPSSSARRWPRLPVSRARPSPAPSPDSPRRAFSTWAQDHNHPQARRAPRPQLRTARNKRGF